MREKSPKKRGGKRVGVVLGKEKAGPLSGGLKKEGVVGKTIREGGVVGC